MSPRIHYMQWSGEYTYVKETMNNYYSMVLTNVAIFHVKYLDMYQKNLPKELKDFVDKQINCEDISMNVIVATHLSKLNNQLICPAVYVSFENLLKRRMEHASGKLLLPLILFCPWHINCTKITLCV